MLGSTNYSRLRRALADGISPSGTGRGKVGFINPNRNREYLTMESGF